MHAYILKTNNLWVMLEEGNQGTLSLMMIKMVQRKSSCHIYRYWNMKRDFLQARLILLINTHYKTSAGVKDSVIQSYML